MGSFTAIGGIKAGVKSVTAFETEDCGTALSVAKFKAFAKPGGSSYVVSLDACTAVLVSSFACTEYTKSRRNKVDERERGDRIQSFSRQRSRGVWYVQVTRKEGGDFFFRNSTVLT